MCDELSSGPVMATAGVAENRAWLASTVNSVGCLIGTDSTPGPRTSTSGSSCTTTVYGLSAMFTSASATYEASRFKKLEWA